MKNLTISWLFFLVSSFLFTGCGETQKQNIDPGTSTNQSDVSNFHANNDTIPYVLIGQAKWSSQNLNTAYFKYGTPIMEAQTTEAWLYAEEKKIPAWCYYDMNQANKYRFGKLYNRYAYECDSLV